MFLPLTVRKAHQRLALRWAYGLQFDIVTEGNTIAETEEMIADAIFEYITFALENNLTKFLFKPASPEYWQKLLYGSCKKHLKLDIYSR